MFSSIRAKTPGNPRKNPSLSVPEGAFGFRGAASLRGGPGKSSPTRNGAVASAVLGAPNAWNRPILTGTGGSDPLWRCWRGQPVRGPV